MPRTCLVTGGAGFIGCAISEDLTEHFDRVIALDNLHPQVHPQPVRPAALHAKVELIVGDVTSAETWPALFAISHPNVIIHLAAETGTEQSLTQASRHAEVNVLGTARMLDALVKHNILPDKIVLASSRAVYGEGAWRNDSTGEIVYPGQRSRTQLELKEWDFPGLKCLPFAAVITEPRPVSIYGVTKLAQEQILKAWALSLGANVAILRLQNVYGPGQSLTNPYTGIVPLFARLARDGKSIPVYEDGDILRDFVFIEDVAAAICMACYQEVGSTLPYDIGSGQAVSIHQLAELIADIYDAPAPHINGAYRNGDVRKASCDITRTIAELGWKPRRKINDGVKELCAWIDRSIADFS